MLWVLNNCSRSLARSLKKCEALARTVSIYGPHFDEVKNAQKAAEAGKWKHRGEPTLFDKIINKEIPADIFYEDEKCLAFNDIAPQAPVHFLVIPKVRIPMLEDTVIHDAEILGYLMIIAGKLGKENAPQGFRTVVNNGLHGCQSIYHLHLHVLGGRQLKWPPG